MSLEEIRKNINSIISKKLLEEKVCTQSDLALYCDVSKTTVGKWCKDTCPTADKIPAICEQLHITIFELLGIKDTSIISNVEKELLEQYKNADESIKEAVKKLLDIKENK